MELNQPVVVIECRPKIDYGESRNQCRESRSGPGSGRIQTFLGSESRIFATTFGSDLYNFYFKN
jgi:hypothetical protein